MGRIRAADGLVVLRSPRQGAGGFRDYELGETEVGKGRFSTVVIADHRPTGARRAVKVIQKKELPKNELTSSGSALSCREVDILKRTDHPNIVRMYEAFETDNILCIVTELCTGGDLLTRVSGKNARLPEPEMASMFAHCVCPVHYLNAMGVAHRDLKPEHYLFSSKWITGMRHVSAPAIKLIDFGLARHVGPEVLAPDTLLTPRLGTVQFLAPETSAGATLARFADRTDSWSLGVILHVMLTGHYLLPKVTKPQTPQSDIEAYLQLPAFDDYSPEVIDLLRALLRKDPSKRATATDVLRHPWLRDALDCTSSDLVYRVPVAVREFARAKPSRQLALLAAARQCEDADVDQVRRLYQLLETECGGRITQNDLRSLIDECSSPSDEASECNKGLLGVVAISLDVHFDKLDTDNSGVVDWCELLAATLSISDGTNLVDPTSALGGPVGSRASGVSFQGALPQLREQACWRAFDALGKGPGSWILHQDKLAQETPMMSGLWPLRVTGDEVDVKELCMSQGKGCSLMCSTFGDFVAKVEQPVGEKDCAFSRTPHGVDSDPMVQIRSRPGGLTQSSPLRRPQKSGKEMDFASFMKLVKDSSHATRLGGTRVLL